MAEGESLLFRDPEPEDESGSVSVVYETAQHVKISDKKCVDSFCTGVRILSADGSGLFGCEFSQNPNPKCTGSCVYCDGNAPLLLCKSSTGDTCEFDGAGGHADCGNSAQNYCFYSTSHGLIQPCWCSNTLGWINTSSISCNRVANCTP